MSDVYAMGGKPLSALSLLAYPADGDLDDLMKDIVRLGIERAAARGAKVAPTADEGTRRP